MKLEVTIWPSQIGLTERVSSLRFSSNRRHWTLQRERLWH